MATCEMTNLKNEVIKLVATFFEVNPEDVTHESKFVEDLGADSLELVEVVIYVEAEYKVDIPDKDAVKLKTVGNLIDYIHSLTTQSKSCSSDNWTLY